MFNRFLILLAGVLSISMLAFICTIYCVDDVEQEKGGGEQNIKNVQQSADRRLTALSEGNDQTGVSSTKKIAPALVEMIKTSEGELHLVGIVESNQERQNLLVAVKRKNENFVVRDNLTVNNDRSFIAPKRMHGVLPIIKDMKSGVVSFWENKTNLTAVVDTQLEKDLLEEQVLRTQWQDIVLTQKIIVLEDQQSTTVSGQISKAEVCQNALNKKSQASSIGFSETNGSEIVNEDGVLHEFLNIIQSCREHLIVIEGHYANSTNSRVNQQQSERFAKQVLQYFQSHSSQALNLVARGKGDTHPLYDNSTVMGRTMNRRIEFKIKEQQE